MTRLLLRRAIPGGRLLTAEKVAAEVFDGCVSALWVRRNVPHRVKLGPAKPVSGAVVGGWTCRRRSSARVGVDPIHMVLMEHMDPPFAREMVRRMKNVDGRIYVRHRSQVHACEIVDFRATRHPSASSHRQAQRWVGAVGADVVRVEWHGTVEQSADDLVEDQADRSALDEAADFLRALLAAGDVPSIDILAKAWKNGITDTTLRHAKVKIGVRARKIGFGEGSWVWSLPDQ